MAQSALKDSGKSPLGIQPFWEKATLEPPLRWVYWRTQLKLAIHAREGIVVDILLADPPEHVILPPEPAYEDANSKKLNPKQLKTFSNEPIQTLGTLQTSIRSNNWYANPIEIQVVKDGHRPLLGRDLFPALGLSIQQSNNQKTVNQVDHEYCPIKTQIATDFPDLISRIGKSKVHTVRSKFHRNYTPSHQKGRRVPINLLDKVSDELKKLSEQGHIEKLQECSDKNFISPIVITVKKDQSVKLVLDSKVLNKAIHKNMYQMPNIDSLIDSISQHINNSNHGDNVYFSTIENMHIIN